MAGLKWGDIVENLETNVTRSVVSQVVGRYKTEASRKLVPLESSVADDLWLFTQTTPYSRPED